MNKNNDHIFVIFGASGDLTKRKLLPAIYNLFIYDQLPEKFAVVGAARSDMTDDEFRNNIINAVKQYENVTDENKLSEFSKLLFYVPTDIEQDSSLISLKNKLEALRKNKSIEGNTIFYLSTPPSLYYVIPDLLSTSGMNKKSDGWKRLIIEKPFGYDLDSAQKLNEILMKGWDEEQIYRIDHYLGKETVQNILVTRFSNGIFEPLWNRNYIDHVEITVAEQVGVEHRAGYYETAGVIRDVFQNHMLQLLALTAMEAPTAFHADSVRDEK